LRILVPSDGDAVEAERERRETDRSAQRREQLAEVLMADGQRTVHLTVGPQPLLVVLVALAGALVTFGVLTAAHRQLGWALAALLVALLLEPLVRALDRHLPRALAIVVGLLLAVTVVGAVVYGVLSDVGNQLDRVREAAPEAARELEQSERFGATASDFRLEQRVQEVVDRLEDPTSGIGNEAASAAGTYFLCGILVIFFLVWGPRYASAAIDQIGDPARRWTGRNIVRQAVRRGRIYVLSAIGRGLVAGAATAALCRWEDVPGPIVLGVTVAATTAMPGFGIMLGALPALLLEAGLGTAGGTWRLLVAFLVLQALDVIVLREVVVPRSVTVGSAAIVIAVVVGFEIYGLGGSVYGAALAVFVVALLDAAADRDITIVDVIPELTEEAPPAAAPSR
jgi:predicted PurR-regulated permease PerM